MRRTRRGRHVRILELVSTQTIHTQEELVEALTDDGWRVTQSSVSRDVAALRLTKGGGVYQRQEGAEGDSADPNEARIANAVLRVDAAAGGLVVVRTATGEASAVALALDRLGSTDIVGTVAGDDTIFIATSDARAQRRILQRLLGLRRDRHR